MRLCTFPDCNKKHYALGYCRAHHINFKRNGDPTPKYDTSGLPRNALGKTKDPKGRGSKEVNIINDLKYKARQREKQWLLTHEQAFTLITGACLYCKKPANWPQTRNGIDRVDNTKDYHIDNCVTCCAHCNSAKMGRSLEEFIDWIRQVYNNIAQ